MKLEQQVTSLELSKKLRALGVKQKSIWYWKFQGEDKWKIKFKDCIDIRYEHSNNFYSAFTVSEIFPLLEQDITIPKGTKNIADYLAKLLVDKLSA